MFCGGALARKGECGTNTELSLVELIKVLRNVGLRSIGCGSDEPIASVFAEVIQTEQNCDSSSSCMSRSTPCATIEVCASAYVAINRRILNSFIVEKIPQVAPHCQ